MTKKLLVPYSDTTGPAKGKVFVAPIWDGKNGVKYVSLPGNKPIEKGMSAFVGTEVTTTEFMARLVDCGFKIFPSYDWQEGIISKYIETIKSIKIGQVVRLIADPDGNIIFEDAGIAKPDSKPKLP